MKKRKAFAKMKSNLKIMRIGFLFQEQIQQKLNVKLLSLENGDENF